MASELIKHVTDATFEADVLQSAQPILVDYWAEWCGPCKMIAPILDEVSATYEGKLQIAKMTLQMTHCLLQQFLQEQSGQLKQALVQHLQMQVLQQLQFNL